MIAFTIGVILIPLMGIGNVACMSLAFVVMNATYINYISMKLLMLILCRLYLLRSSFKAQILTEGLVFPFVVTRPPLKHVELVTAALHLSSDYHKQWICGPVSCME